MDQLSFIRLNDGTITGKSLRARNWNASGIRLVDDAIERSIIRGMTGEVSPIIVLWAMLRWEKKLGLAIIERCGVDLFSLEQSVKRELDSIAPPMSAPYTFDFRPLADLCSLAEHESELLQFDFVGTEHVSLALCHVPDPLIQKLFSEHGVGYEAMLSNLKSLLYPEGPVFE